MLQNKTIEWENKINLARKILNELISESSNKLIMESSLINSFIKKLGKSHIEDELNNIHNKITADLKITNPTLNQENTIFSLETLDITPKPTRTVIAGANAYVYRKAALRKKKNDYLINLVFPCRNSEKVISNSLSFLFSEINKSFNIDFTIAIQLNSTRDSSLLKIAQLLQQSDISDIDISIIETDPDINITLPGSLNLGQKYLNDITNPNSLNNPYKETFFSFWDDEIKSIQASEISIFNSNMSVLLSSGTNRAISGHMIDNRENISFWHQTCQLFSSKISIIESKPYLHGGAGVLVKWVHFPEMGIHLGGIADNDLAADLLLTLDYDELKKLNYRTWPVRTNPEAVVFHPVEQDIVSWTTKCLMYQLSWEKVRIRMEKKDSQISSLWLKTNDAFRQHFHNKIIKEFINIPNTKMTTKEILAWEFMHYYYRNISTSAEKERLYEIFFNFRSRSHFIS